MPTLETIIATKVTGLGEISTLKGEMAGLGAETEALSAKSSTLGGASSLLSGRQAVQKAETAGLKTEMAGLGVQAEAAAAGQGKLATVTTTLASSQLGQKVAAAETTAATSSLALAQGEVIAKTQAQSGVMQESTAVLASLAAVDGSLIGTKKGVTKAVEEEGQAHAATTAKLREGLAATGQFGEAAVAASTKASLLGSVLGGAGGVSVGLGAFVIGAGAAVAVGKSSIDTFARLGEEVLHYQRVTGASADESSRMVDVFGQLGVKGDAAASAMFMLNKRIEGLDGAVTKNAKSLEQVGVEIAKNADGSTNLEKTLFNVADAYNLAGSAAQRDTIASIAFGKQGQALIPVLEQGSAGLRRMADEATLVFDQQQLDQVRRYNEEMARAGQEIDKTKSSVGGTLLPIIGGITQAWNDAAAADAYALQKQKEHGDANERYISWYPRYRDEGQKVVEQSRHNAEATAQETAQYRLLDEALRQTEAASKALYDQDLKHITAGLAKEQADIRVREAQKSLADETLRDTEFVDKHRAAYDHIAVAQATYTAAVKAHGAASLQAKTAQDALNTATDTGKNVDQQGGDAAVNLARDELALKEAMIRDAEATVKAAEETANLGGETLSTRQKSDLFRATLETLAATLAPGSVLRSQLQAYIDQLANIPADKTTNLHLNVIGGTPQYPTYGIPGGMQVTSAEGGVFTRPTLTWVGEAGPEAVIPIRQGNTMPGASPLESLSRRGGNESGGHTFNFYGISDPDVIARSVLARLRDYDTLHA